MKFSRFADYLEKLEATPKRNELVSILAELFRDTKPEEIDKVAYLLQGRVAPFFEPIEIGMAGKMVEQAIARAYDVEREEASKLVSKLGDGGLAAQELATKKGLHSDGPTVVEVFQGLFDISTYSGEGTVEKKVGALINILAKVDAKSAKHIVRVPLGRTRLGIGDPTVLDALSYAKTSDKSLRKDLEDGYNKTSDLGFVARVFWEKGIEAIKKMKIRVGKPVRPALAERLPNAEQIVKRMTASGLDKFAVEFKYDGFRTQIHKMKNEVSIYSRNLENMTPMFPDLVKAVREEVKVEEAIFEGEAIAYNVASGEYYPFQETTKRRRKYGIDEAITRLPLKLITFDILYKNGEDVTALPYSKRRKLIQEAIKKDADTILIADEYLLKTEKELTDTYNEALTRGLEGVMVKKLDGTYQAGARNFNWVKFKKMVGGELSDTVDTVLLGYVYGTGKRTAFGVGALLVGVYDQEKDEFVSISRIGTGLTDEEWRHVITLTEKLKVAHKPARVNSLITPSVWVEPKIVLEIFADEITRSPLHTAGKVGDEPGYALRFPRVISFRGADKRAEDATTVDEIAKLYSQQTKVKR